jgi:hypothetical protein
MDLQQMMPPLTTSAVNFNKSLISTPHPLLMALQMEQQHLPMVILPVIQMVELVLLLIAMDLEL